MHPPRRPALLLPHADQPSTVGIKPIPAAFTRTVPQSLPAAIHSISRAPSITSSGLLELPVPESAAAVQSTPTANAAEPLVREACQQDAAESPGGEGIGTGSQQSPAVHPAHVMTAVAAVPGERPLNDVAVPDSGVGDQSKKREATDLEPVPKLDSPEVAGPSREQQAAPDTGPAEAAVQVISSVSSIISLAGGGVQPRIHPDIAAALGLSSALTGTAGSVISPRPSQKLSDAISAPTGAAATSSAQSRGRKSAAIVAVAAVCDEQVLLEPGEFIVERVVGMRKRNRITEVWTYSNERNKIKLELNFE